LRAVEEKASRKWGKYGVHCVFSSLRASERLHGDRVQERHVLGSSDVQLVCGVVVDDLGDGGEGGAVLPEDVAPLWRASELHVHEALTAPGRRETHI